MKESIVLLRAFLAVAFLFPFAALAARPVAQWDVVPDQRIDQPFNIGVVAFHPDGVKVEFRVGDNLVATAEKPTLNERTGVWEYWFTFDPKTQPDGPVLIAARAIPLNPEHPSYDLPPLPLLANGGGSLTVKEERWVDAVNGDDSAAGTKEAPFKTLARAVKDTPAGGTINLLPGTYSADALGGGKNRDQWTTVQAAPGVERDKVEIEGGRPGTERLHFKNVVLFCDRADGRYVSILYGPGLKIWCDNVKFTNKAGRHAAGSTAFNAYTPYITGGITTEMMNGPGGRLIRGHTLERIGSDAFSGGNRLVVNSSCIDIDRGPTEAHPDFHQSYSREPEWTEDVILYNVRGLNCNSQGLFGSRLRNSAFVNVLFERVPNSPALSQYSPPLDNVMFFHVSLARQSWLWRSKADPLPPTSDVRMINSVVEGMGLLGTMTADGLSLTHNHFVAANRTMGENVSTGDPQYVDPDKSDYRPKAGSPLIGTGLPLQCVPADINGKPWGDKPNRGAFAAE